MRALRGVAGQALRRPVRMSAIAVAAAGGGTVAALALAGGSAAAAHPAELTPFTVTGPVQQRAVSPWSGITLNGKPANDANGQAGEPWFSVAAGEKVTIEVTVTVPPHDQMTKLFLGVSVNGAETGVGPRGPIGMTPVLATAARLTAGTHVITAHWTVPAGAGAPAPGYQVSAAAYWPRGTVNEPAAEGAPLASVIVKAGPG